MKMRLSPIITTLFFFLGSMRAFAAYDIVIPEIGETCILDPKTGQCAADQSFPTAPIQGGSGSDFFEIDAPAPKPAAPKTVPVKSSAPTPSPEPEILIKEEIELPFLERPEIRDFLQNIGIPSSITIAAVSGSALLLTAAAGNIQVALNVTNIFEFLDSLRLQLLGLVRLKKRKPWGMVLEKLNGRPISGARVNLFSAEFNKILDSYLTDAEGRFEFLANSGVYFLKISQKGFIEAETDPIHIKSAEQVISKEIFLSPEIKSLGVGTIFRINIFNLIFRFIDFLNPPLLVFGTLLSVAAALSMPSQENYLILGVYGLLDLIKIYLAFSLIRPDGYVFNKEKNPVKNAVVRIFDAKKNLLVTTSVSDKNGKFNILLVSGKYYLTCTANGYKAYRSDEITVSKGSLLNLRIRLDK